MRLAMVQMAQTLRLSPAMWQTALLLGVDALTNGTDYAFHLFLGRVLTPGDFANFQTINAALLIVITSAAVLQPVIARYAAESERGDPAARGAFQSFLRQGTLLGVVGTAVVILLRQPLAAWLNVPATAVGVTAFMVFFTLTRPVVAGMLQGQRQFVPFGLTRTAFAVGRLLLALLFIVGLGGGLLAALVTLPLGAMLALGVGFLFLGKSVWQRAPALGGEALLHGWRLSLAALLAYTAYMTLLNLDLIWVNRLFAPEVAGAYATAVVLRRAILLLPGAAVVIFFPRVVATVSEGRRPDRLLLKTIGLIGGTAVFMTFFFFVLGELVITVFFGAIYAAGAPLLGWMGVGMIGVSLAMVWLNLFLATRPWPFVALLLVTAVGHAVTLARWHPTPEAVLTSFIVAAWLLGVGGALLYTGWLRPRLAAGVEIKSPKVTASKKNS